MLGGEAHESDMRSKMEFVDGVAAGGGATGSAAPDGTNGVAPMYRQSEEPLPSYASILSAHNPLMTKVQQLYNVSAQHATRNFSALRPWAEFFDSAFFRSPAGVADVVDRLNRNLSYFYANYLVLSLACSSYILLINLPFAVYVFMVVTGYLFVRNRSAAVAVLAAQGAPEEDQRVYLCKHSFSISQLYMMLIVFGVVGFYLTSGSSIVFWLLLTSIGVSFGHASMRRPPLQDSSFDFV